MIEIGSEFWRGSTPLNGSGVAQIMPAGMDVRYTLCGRTALELVLQDVLSMQCIQTAYLPSYCCHTVIEPFVSKGIAVSFYHVFFKENGIGMEFDSNNNCDLVFLMDYFGFRNDEMAWIIRQQKALGKCVVYDVTHAMFCQSVDYSGCDYVFGSFRKWFGVNAGFCAKEGEWMQFPDLLQNRKYTDMRNWAFGQKQRFMNGETVKKNTFLNVFAQAENDLERSYVQYAPDAESLQILAAVNVQYIRQRRRENAKIAIQVINSMESAQVRSPNQTVGEADCPLFVPLWVAPDKRSALRAELISNRIYLPIHWPVSAFHKTDAITKAIYETELSFVCDQRYTHEDMERATQIVRRFINTC